MIDAVTVGIKTRQPSTIAADASPVLRRPPPRRNATEPNAIPSTHSTPKKKTPPVSCRSRSRAPCTKSHNCSAPPIARAAQPAITLNMTARIVRAPSFSPRAQSPGGRAAIPKECRKSTTAVTMRETEMPNATSHSTGAFYGKPRRPAMLISPATTGPIATVRVKTTLWPEHSRTVGAAETGEVMASCLCALSLNCGSDLRRAGQGRRTTTPRATWASSRASSRGRAPRCRRAPRRYGRAVRRGW